MLGECCRFWCSGGGGGGESGEQTHTQLMPVLTSSPSVGQPQKSNIYNNLNVTTTEMITLFSLLAIKHPLYISAAPHRIQFQDLKKCTKF